MKKRFLSIFFLFGLPACFGAQIQALEIEIDAQNEKISSLEERYDALQTQLSSTWSVDNTQMRMLGPSGGNGGSPFEQVCPEGEIAIGIVGRNGALIDQIRVVCAPLLREK